MIIALTTRLSTDTIFEMEIQATRLELYMSNAEDTISIKAVTKVILTELQHLYLIHA